MTNIETLLGGESEPRFPAGRLDLVVMRAVIQFDDDSPRFLQAASAGLKEGGRFVLLEGETGEPSTEDAVVGSGRIPARKGYLEIFRRAGLVLVSAQVVQDREPPKAGSTGMTVFVLKKEKR